MNLRELRKRDNVTQQELSDIIGISRNQLNAYEAGRMNPSVKNKRKIAEHFKVDVSEIIDLSAAPKSSVKYYRQMRNLTQKELAEMTGQGASNLVMIESGKRMPSIEKAILISKTLKVPVAEIWKI